MGQDSRSGGLTALGLRVPSDRLQIFVKSVLLRAQVREDVASHVADGLVQASLRGVDSHGVRLLPHYLAGVQGGRINPNPRYRFQRTSGATGLLDADHTFGHAAGMEAAGKAMELAAEVGAGHVAVYNSSHFGAAAFFALEIARHDMIGMSFTNADALLKTWAGKRPFLGNNPICFAAPCEGEEPVCLDMATSVVSFNKVRQLREEGQSAEPGTGSDRDGRETTNPHEIAMLLPIGGYKGYGLSLMVEILCSLLTGMPYGLHIPKMYEAPMSQRRLLAHFVSALRIDCFQDPAVFKARLSGMLRELRSEPRANPDVPIQIPGDPEKRHARQRAKTGIPLSEEEARALAALAKEYGVDSAFPLSYGCNVPL